MLLSQEMRIRNLFIYSMLIFFFTNCKKGLKEVSIVEDKNVTTELTNKIWYEVKFPDTVYVNEKYDGNVNFISAFDSITTEFGNQDKYRYVFTALTINHNVEYDFDYLRKIVKDTFGAVDNRQIPIRDLSFPKKGIYYIDGLINDAVFIDLQKEDENGDDLVRWIENEVRITKKVIVIDK